MNRITAIAPASLALLLALTACGGSGSVEQSPSVQAQTVVDINSAEDLSDLITDAGFDCEYFFSSSIDKESDRCGVEGGKSALVSYYTSSHYAAEGLAEYDALFKENDQKYYAVSGDMWIVWSGGKHRDIIEAVADGTGEEMVVYERN